MPMTAAPRLAMFCSDDAGAVKVAVNPNGANGYANTVYYNDIGGGFNGGRIIRGRAVMIQNNIEWDGVDYAMYNNAPGGPSTKSLAEVKFDAYDMTGRMVSRKEALKRLQAGGMVLLAGDNRFPDPEYLKAFRDDLLVLVSGEFVFQLGQTNPYDMPVKVAANQPGKPAPPAAPAAPVIGVAVPVGNVQIAPAIIKPVKLAPAQVAPAVAKPAAVKPAADNKQPAAKPEEKPAEKPVKPADPPPAKPAEKPPVKP
jgi:hypothetical protein